MAGKYAHIIDKLPRALGTEPAYQEKVNAVKAKLREESPRLSGWTAAELSMKYKQVRSQKEAAEAIVSDIQLELEAVCQMMENQYEAEGVTTIGGEGGSVALQKEPQARVVDKAKFRLWCIANGLEESLSLPWQTTNAITKEYLLAGQPEPDGVLAESRVKWVLRKS
jgi:hypothetical protein